MGRGLPYPVNTLTCISELHHNRYNLARPNYSGTTSMDEYIDFNEKDIHVRLQMIRQRM